MKIYISGIDTNVGKTHVCATFCATFGYDYFKLIQAGTPQDSSIIESFSPKTRIFKNGFTLQTPTSPHIAKDIENAKYDGLKIAIPHSENLVIEIAGGLFSPLDSNVCMIDYMSAFKYPSILVGTYYLGCINHILLSIESLKMRNIELLALIMTKNETMQNITQIDKFIESYSGTKIIHLDYFDKNNFSDVVERFKKDMILF